MSDTNSISKFEFEAFIREQLFLLQIKAERTFEDNIKVISLNCFQVLLDSIPEDSFNPFELRKQVEPIAQHFAGKVNFKMFDDDGNRDEGAEYLLKTQAVGMNGVLDILNGLCKNIH